MTTTQKLSLNTTRSRTRRSLPFAFPAICLLAMTLAILPAAAQPQSAPSAKQSASPTRSQSSTAVEKPKAKPFNSPEAAAAALRAAARRNDDADLLVILGPNGKDLIAWSDDSEERASQRAQFAQKYDQMHRLIKEPDDTVTLYVGPENWPLPIPLVEYNGAWYFDSELGKQEILYRRIGRNEVEALEVCHALIDAEKEYSATAHTYTAKFISAGDSHDGLYWKSANATQKSPIGPYLAHAGVSDSADGNRKPYHGYYYRILLRAPVAPNGDARHSTEHGNANDAFTIVAFPAEYRSSGVMTFVMDENGDAYEKDLGPTTATVAEEITTFHPDSTWQKVQ